MHCHYCCTSLRLVSLSGSDPGVWFDCAWEVRSSGHAASAQETGGSVSSDEIQPRHTGACQQSDSFWFPKLFLVHSSFCLSHALKEFPAYVQASPIHFTNGSPRVGRNSAPNIMSPEGGARVVSRRRWLVLKSREQDS